jgi:hypothetical protein
MLTIHNMRARGCQPFSGKNQMFDFIFETNLGYESGDRVGAFDEKNRSQKSRASVPLRWHIISVLIFS